MIYQGFTGDDLIRAVAIDIFNAIDNLEKKVMFDLDQMMAEIQSEAATLEELAMVVARLHDHVKSHASGTVVPPVLQNKINSVMAGVEANKASLAKAMETAKAAVATAETVMTGV
jgi:hypothetical protein